MEPHLARALPREVGPRPADPMDVHDLTWLSVHRLYGNRATAVSREHFRAVRAEPRSAADRATQTMLNLRRSTSTQGSSPPPWCTIRGGEARDRERWLTQGSR